MFRKNWKEFSGRADSTVRSRHSQTHAEQQPVCPHLFPSLSAHACSFKSPCPLPFSPFGSGPKYPRTGLMHFPNSLVHHPSSLRRSLSPCGDPGACLGAPLRRWPRKETGQGVSASGAPAQYWASPCSSVLTRAEP